MEGEALAEDEAELCVPELEDTVKVMFVGVEVVELGVSWLCVLPLWVEFGTDGMKREGTLPEFELKAL